MLTTSNIHDLNYYLDLSAEDYYLAGGEPDGMWAGLGALSLNLKGTVSDQDFKAVFSGFAPDGSELCRNAGKNHRPGWDLTLSAPKSVSVVWARADASLRAEIQEAQKAATLSALKLLEKHAAFTRMGAGGAVQEPVIGLVATLFEHSTSRELDPQLHTHLLVANVAPCRDGEFRTLEGIHFLMWQKAAGAIYRNTLAQKLRHMGFSIHKSNDLKSFEIMGVPSEISNHFSKRSKAINYALSMTNAKTSASPIGDKIKLTSRKHKTKIDRSILFNQWAKELDSLGFTENAAQGILRPYDKKVMSPTPLLPSIESLTSQNSTFKIQNLYEQIALDSINHNSTYSEIENSVSILLKSNLIVDIGIDEKNNRILTTPEIIAIEKDLIKQSKIMSLNKTSYRLDASTIDQALESFRKSRNFSLSEEQEEALRKICVSQLDIIQGAAGAGKSTSLQVAKEAYEVAGMNVIGATVSRQAANLLQNETGIRSYTLAMLILELDKNKLSLKNTVLVLDEAGLIGALDLHKIITHVRKVGGKVILSGEEKQLDAITHGGCLRLLSKLIGCATIETIRRQRDSWARDCVSKLRIGKSIDVINEYENRGFLYWSNNSEHAYSELLSCWNKFRKANPSKKSLIIANSWKEVQEISKRIRSIYQEEGKVRNENVRLRCSVSGKQLDFEFSIGDRVKLCRNDYARNITNGTLATITNIQQINDAYLFSINTDDGRSLNINSHDYCDELGSTYISHAYALTVYSSQGCTIDGDVFVLHSAAMDRAASYVAGSRHKDNVHWFINENELRDFLPDYISYETESRMSALAKCMDSDRKKSMALEYFDLSDISQEITPKKQNFLSNDSKRMEIEI